MSAEKHDPTEGSAIPDFGGLNICRYPHGGARAWRDLPDGTRDLVMDLYEPAERRDAILAALDALPKLRARLEYAEELLDRVQVKGGSGDWDESELLDWCCDYKDFKNGWPPDRIRRHSAHKNCGHRRVAPPGTPRVLDNDQALRTEVERLRTRLDELASADGEHVRYEDHAAALAAKEEEIRRLKNLNAVYEGQTRYECKDCGGTKLGVEDLERRLREQVAEKHKAIALQVRLVETHERDAEANDALFQRAVELLSEYDLNMSDVDTLIDSLKEAKEMIKAYHAFMEPRKRIENGWL